MRQLGSIEQLGSIHTEDEDLSLPLFEREAELGSGEGELRDSSVILFTLFRRFNSPACRLLKFRNRGNCTVALEGRDPRAEQEYTVQ